MTPASWRRIALLGALAVSLTAAARPKGPVRRELESEQRLPRFGSAATASRPPVALPDTPPSSGCAQGCRELTFRRPTGCELKKRTPGRKTYTCAREEQRLVTVSATGVVQVRKGPTRPARNPYPLELVPQWRYCPFASDAELEQMLVPYEDPDVGRCYLLRPEAPAGTVRGAHLTALSNVHPYLAEATEALIRLAEARGQSFKVISTVRAAKKTTKTISRQVKAGRRIKTVEEVIARYQGGGWHAFGLAVDINLSHRKDLGSATSAYLSGGEEREAWLEIGAQGESFGLIWIGRNDPGEIFHFEWHPGWPGMPKGELYQRLASKADRDGIPSVWSELRYDPSRSTRFAHLADPAARPLGTADVVPVPDEPVAPAPTKRLTAKERKARAKAERAAAKSRAKAGKAEAEAPAEAPATGKAAKRHKKPKSKRAKKDTKAAKDAASDPKGAGDGEGAPKGASGKRRHKRKGAKDDATEGKGDGKAEREGKGASKSEGKNDDPKPEKAPKKPKSSRKSRRRPR